MTHRSDTFVEPTTAQQEPQFYAACETCQWQVYAPLFASVEFLAEQHIDQCPEPGVLVAVVRYIGGGNHEGEAGL